MSARLSAKPGSLRLLALISLAILLLRGWQTVELLNSLQAPESISWTDTLLHFDNLAVGAFLVIPIFAMYWTPILKFQAAYEVITRCVTSGAMLARLVKSAMLRSLALSFLLTGSVAFVLLCLFPRVALTLDSLLIVLKLTILRAEFLFCCALVVSLVYVMTERLGFAVVALFIYGIWDYLIANVPYLSGAPIFLGWQLIQAQIGAAPGVFFLAGLWFLVFGGCLIIALMWVLRGKEHYGSEG